MFVPLRFRATLADRIADLRIMFGKKRQRRKDKMAILLMVVCL
jgi:hypothetical protein